MASLQIFGMSIIIGILLFSLTILFGWISNQYQVSFSLLKWILLPTLAFVFSSILNGSLQYITCKSLNIQQILISSSTIILAVIAFLFISSLGFMRSAIDKILPLSVRVSFGTFFAVAFYMFWAGMFGEAFASGFVQSCASK